MRGGAKQAGAFESLRRASYQLHLYNFQGKEPFQPPAVLLLVKIKIIRNTVYQNTITIFSDVVGFAVSAKFEKSTMCPRKIELLSIKKNIELLVQSGEHIISYQHQDMNILIQVEDPRQRGRKMS